MPQCHIPLLMHHSRTRHGVSLQVQGWEWSGLTVNPCLKSTVSEDASCVLDHNCTLQRAFASAQNAMKQTLAGYSLRSLVGVEVPTAIP